MSIEYNCVILYYHFSFYVWGGGGGDIVLFRRHVVFENLEFWNRFIIDRTYTIIAKQIFFDN